MISQNKKLESTISQNKELESMIYQNKELESMISQNRTRRSILFENAVCMQVRPQTQVEGEVNRKQVNRVTLLLVYGMTFFKKLLKGGAFYDSSLETVIAFIVSTNRMSVYQLIYTDFAGCRN
jgi:hypothetical protein